MIRNTTAARQVMASHSAHSVSQQQTRPGQVLFRARRRRAGTHAVFSNPTTITVREYITQPTTSVTRVSPSAAAGTSLSLSSSSRAVAPPIRSATAGPTARFSTTPSSHLAKKHTAKHAEKSTIIKAGSAAIEGDVIYRKEGGKIVPVAMDVTDQVEAPVSGLFSQFEDFNKPSSASE